MTANTISWKRALTAALVPSVLIALVAEVLLLVWWSDLPERVATHFRGWGHADGFTDRSSLIWLMLLGPVITLVMTTLMLLSSRDLRVGRPLVAVASGVGSLIACTGAAVVSINHGLDDPHDARLRWPWLLVVIVVGIGAGAVSVWWLPHPHDVDANEPPPPDTPRLAVRDGQRISWSGTATMPRALSAGLALLPIAIIGIVTAFWPHNWIIPVIIGVALGILLFVLTAFPIRVLIDETGLTVRGLMALGRRHIPISQVAQAQSLTVGWLNRFGGIGYRIGAAGIGIIPRPGPVIAVTRGDGSCLAVGVDGAEEAAAVLNTLAERAHAHR
ncbi:DUF1648 domain-containing protein [Jongsikchunia kroppenstedtii]|uniref:DUF1648 domain-containing protein n=1 Tax=Jongsikchunia kroppenstedtii TaxID=1121721 RepID=UPI00036A49FE|nr:DUF1648 domain-containing protein [Jongsikchunia kroppenstedtii]